MAAQLISSIVIFATASFGCGMYFMRMEFIMAGFNAGRNHYRPRHGGAL